MVLALEQGNRDALPLVSEPVVAWTHRGARWRQRKLGRSLLCGGGGVWCGVCGEGRSLCTVVDLQGAIDRVEILIDNVL